MNVYDPMCAPDPQDWLALDDAARLALVYEYHRTAGLPLPSDSLHAACHVMVETQLATNQPAFVRPALERLMQEGLDRSAAINAICMVLSWSLCAAEDEDRTLIESWYEQDLNEISAEAYRVHCKHVSLPEYDELLDTEKLLKVLDELGSSDDSDELEGLEDLEEPAGRD